MIAGLLPERLWGGDVVESWRRVEKRARAEQWLGEEEKEKDRMEAVKVGSGEKRQGKGPGVGRKKLEIGGKEGILRRSKRKRPEKDVDAEEREDEEMATDAKKVWRRMMIMAVGRKKPKAKDCGDGDYNCACSGKNPMDLVPADTNCGQKLNEGKELLALLKRNNECRTRNQSRERVIVLRKVKWVVCGHRMEVRSEGVQRVQGRV